MWTVDVSHTRGGLLKDTAVPCLDPFTRLAHPDPRLWGTGWLLSPSLFSGDMCSVDKSSLTQKKMHILSSGGSPQPKTQPYMCLIVRQLCKATYVPESSRSPQIRPWLDHVLALLLPLSLTCISLSFRFIPESLPEALFLHNTSWDTLKTSCRSYLTFL